MLIMMCSDAGPTLDCRLSGACCATRSAPVQRASRVRPGACPAAFPGHTRLPERHAGARPPHASLQKPAAGMHGARRKQGPQAGAARISRGSAHLRRRPNGSADALGAQPTAHRPTRLSRRSATATRMPAGVRGSSSPACARRRQSQLDSSHVGAAFPRRAWRRSAGDALVRGALEGAAHYRGSAPLFQPACAIYTRSTPDRQPRLLPGCYMAGLPRHRAPGGCRLRRAPLGARRPHPRPHAAAGCTRQCGGMPGRARRRLSSAD